MHLQGYADSQSTSNNKGEVLTGDERAAGMSTEASENQKMLYAITTRPACIHHSQPASTRASYWQHDLHKVLAQLVLCHAKPGMASVSPVFMLDWYWETTLCKHYKQCIGHTLHARQILCCAKPAFRVGITQLVGLTIQDWDCHLGLR